MCTGNWTQSSAGVASTLNHSAISPAPIVVVVVAIIIVVACVGGCFVCICVCLVPIEARRASGLLELEYRELLASYIVAHCSPLCFINSSFTVQKNPFWNVLKDHDFPPPKAKNVIGLHLRPIAEISLLCWSLSTWCSQQCIFMCVYVGLGVCMCSKCVQVRLEAREGVRSSGAVVMGGCQPTQVLCNNSKNAFNCWAFSPLLYFKIHWLKIFFVLLL